MASFRRFGIRVGYESFSEDYLMKIFTLLFGATGEDQSLA